MELRKVAVCKERVWSMIEGQKRYLATSIGQGSRGEREGETSQRERGRTYPQGTVTRSINSTEGIKRMLYKNVKEDI